MSVRKNMIPIYPVLEAEITKRGIKKKDIAYKLGILPRTLSTRLVGETDFYLSEVIAIHDFFPDIAIEVLFSKK